MSAYMNGAGSGTATGLKTATTTVVVQSATAPTSGQVLTATSGTAADWETPAGGSAAGSTGYVQFNTSNAFAADPGLTWNNTTKTLNIGDGSHAPLLNMTTTGTSAGSITFQDGANPGNFFFEIGTRGSSIHDYYIYNGNIGVNDIAFTCLYASKGVGIYKSAPATNTFEVGIATKFDSTVQMFGDTTGSTALVIGTNSPATTGTAPFTHLKFIAADGSTVWVPAWK